MLTMVMGNINLISNPVFMDVEGSGINRTPMVNKPGQRLTLKANGRETRAPSRCGSSPPRSRAWSWISVKFWIERMENISGLQGTSKGQQAQGRQASATVQATQEAGFVSIRSSLRNLERALQELGQILCQAHHHELRRPPDGGHPRTRRRGDQPEAGGQPLHAPDQGRARPASSSPSPSTPVPPSRPHVAHASPRSTP